MKVIITKWKEFIMNFEMDTITAIASAPAMGAIGIIRISGDLSYSILKNIYRSKSGKKRDDFLSHMMVYGNIVDSQNNILDEVMVVYMKSPKTYTCEDIVEIYCHGGMISLQNILQEVLRNGGRMAEVGEFTKRAFLNGRIDLAQAESVMDVIGAKTNESFDIALSQLEGKLSTKISSIRKKVLNLLSELAVSIDYPEEDIEEITYNQIHEILNMTINDIKKLIDSSNMGQIIRDGLSVAIVGKPNVGKSSLLNQLAEESRAIVTDIAGTTRDVIDVMVNIHGIPIKLFDTAGIRDTDDIVEKIGVQKSKDAFNNADLVLFMINQSEELSLEDEVIIDNLLNKKMIVILNKNDLPKKIDIELLKNKFSNNFIIETSMTQNRGLEKLKDTIKDMFYNGQIYQKESTYVTNSRHIRSLEQAYESFIMAKNATNDNMPYDFIETDIRQGYEYLGEIIGAVVQEDLIQQIFSQFCLGK